MIYQKFSKRQNLTLTWWNRPKYKDYDGIICDGSIRSGKTVSMTDGFILWSMSSFNGQNFAICGKTIESLRRNVVTLMPQWLEGIFTITERRSENKLIITANGKTNYYYMFGGKDESSYTLVQGITLAGVLFDEVALMPRSFVEQAMARCSVDGSKLWFNCNPEHPMHWFHEEWIRKHKEKNCFYLHFTMKDNPSLTPSIVRRYEKLYSGAFYERFVLGKWVAAQGCVYPMFSQEKHVVTPPDTFGRYYISCDYGTVNPSSFGLWGENGGKWYRIREYYFNSRTEGSQRTDSEHYASLCDLAGNLGIEAVIVDPSAASFIECIRREGRFRVIPAKNDVIDGIRKVSDCLKERKILFSSECRDSIREFGLYRWEENAVKDAVRKENDHAMDDIRYFVSTVVAAQSDGEIFAVAVRR